MFSKKKICSLNASSPLCLLLRFVFFLLSPCLLVFCGVYVYYAGLVYSCLGLVVSSHVMSCLASSCVALYCLVLTHLPFCSFSCVVLSFLVLSRVNQAFLILSWHFTALVHSYLLVYIYRVLPGLVALLDWLQKSYGPTWGNTFRRAHHILWQGMNYLLSSALLSCLVYLSSWSFWSCLLCWLALSRLVFWVDLSCLVLSFALTFLVLCRLVLSCFLAWPFLSFHYLWRVTAEL